MVFCILATHRLDSRVGQDVNQTSDSPDFAGPECGVCWWPYKANRASAESVQHDPFIEPVRGCTLRIVGGAETHVPGARTYRYIKDKRVGMATAGEIT